MQRLGLLLALLNAHILSGSTPTLSFTQSSASATTVPPSFDPTSLTASFTADAPSGGGTINPDGGGFLGLTVNTSAATTLYVSTSIPKGQDWLEIVFAPSSCPANDTSYSDYTLTRVPYKESVNSSALLCIKTKPAPGYSVYRGIVLVAIGSFSGPSYQIDVSYQAFPSPTVTFVDPSSGSDPSLSGLSSGMLTANTVPKQWTIGFQVSSNTPQGSSNPDLVVTSSTDWISTSPPTYDDPSSKASGTFQITIDASDIPSSPPPGSITAMVGGGSNSLQINVPSSAISIGTTCPIRQIGGRIFPQPGESAPFRDYLLPGEGTATISWFASDTPNGVDVTVGSPTGPLFAHSDPGNDGVSLGSATTAPPPWALNGLMFFLLDHQTKSTLAQYTIGSLPVFTASPSLLAQNGSQFTLSWYAPNANQIEIHVGSPTGPLFARVGTAGEMTISPPWGGNGTWFYLVDPADPTQVIDSLVLGGSQPVVQAIPPYALPGQPTVVKWFAPGHQTVQLMVGDNQVLPALTDPTEGLVARGPTSGETPSFTWAANGKTFFLIDGDLSSTPQSLAQFTIGAKPFLAQQILKADSNDNNVVWSGGFGIPETQVRVDSPTGTPFTGVSGQAGSQEIQQSWASNGRGFFLMDGSSDNPASCATAKAALIFGIGQVPIPTVTPVSTLTVHVVLGDPANPSSLATPAGAGIPIQVNGLQAGMTDGSGSITTPVQNGRLFITASAGQKYGAIDVPDTGAAAAVTYVILW